MCNHTSTNIAENSTHMAAKLARYYDGAKLPFANRRHQGTGMDPRKASSVEPSSLSLKEGGFDRNSDETIDAYEAAKLLHCDFEQVEYLARRGELPATKIGRGWIFLRSQLIQSIAERAKIEAQLRRSSRPQMAAAPCDTEQSSHASSPRPRGRPRKRVSPPLTREKLRETTATRVSEPNPILAD